MPAPFWARVASRREAIEGFHVDEHEYHMGLLRHRGAEKQAYQCFRKLLLSCSTSPQCL
jgi:hypothetical protein